MGTRRNPTNGIVVFDEHFLDTTYLAANTGAANTSSYTEQEPQPGQVTRVGGQSLVPVITNAQDDTTVGVRVQRAGYAGRAGLAYSLDGGTTWRGWNGVKPIGWEGVGGLYTTADDWSVYAVTVIPETQLMVLVYAESGTGSVYCRTREHDEESWSDPVEVTTSSALALGLVYTPDERLVLIRVGANQRISTMYSADAGATWATLARAEDVGIDLGFDPETGGFDAILVGESQILAFATEAAGDTVQLGSPDLGISWHIVSTFSDSLAGGVRLARGLDGSALAAYTDSPSTMRFKRFSSAFVSWTTAAQSNPTSLSGDDHAIAVDADDNVYLFSYSNGPGQHDAILYTSSDYGTSWTSETILDLRADDSPDNTDLDNIRMVAAAGRLWVFHQSLTGASSVDGSLTALKLSSWTTREWDGSPDMTWIPIELPDNVNWTASGAGTGDLFFAHLRIVTAANTLHYTFDGVGHSMTPCLHAILSCTVGASSSAAAGAQVTATSAGATYALRALVWDDTLQIRDNIAGASIVDIALDGTEDLEVLLWFEGAGAGRASYKRPNDVEWTPIPEVSAHAFTDGGALEANCWVRIGVLSSSTVTAFYRFASFYEAFDGTRTGSGQIGKRLSSSPYPLPGALDADGRMAHLSVRGGLGLPSEVYTIAPSHTYAIQHAFVGLYPDPVAMEWRSVDDDSDVIVAFDLGGSTHIGHALAIYLDRANFRTAYLEYHNGSTWDTLATYDGATGFTSLSFARDGAAIYPVPAGTSDSDRMLQEQEFARAGGGFAILNDNVGSGDVACKICSNTSGWWTANNTARAIVNLEDIDGTEPAGGTATLVAPGGLLIAYTTSFTPRRRWRIRIPAQLTADGFFRLGVGFSIGRVIPFGLGWGWGAGAETKAQFDTYTNAAGAEDRASRGDQIRTWSVAWTDGIPMRLPRSVVDADYIGVSGGQALEPLNATPFQLSGLMDRTDGQTRPVVAVSALPSATSTITDRTLFLYGLLANSLAQALAQGQEGENEVVRYETVKVGGFPGC